MSAEKLALVLGATGGIGGEVARALHRRGWRVRAMARNPEAALKALPEIEWVTGDAMRADDVIAAARGATLIFHGVNPPGYRNWNTLVLPMMANTIAAAKASGARIVLPGTVYNFGPETIPLIGEDAPQNPRTRKGKIRVALERRMEEAAREGVRSLIVRAGDFFGPRSTANSWFAQIVKPGRAVSSLTYPGARKAGHAWAYLPDLAETFARLIERESELPAFARFHFGGHYFSRGVEIAERTRAIAGAPSARINGFPWAAVIALSPFVALLREMREMRYLWRETLQLDNAKLVAFLGDEPHTRTDAALARTLEGLGCMPPEPAPGPQAQTA